MEQICTFPARVTRSPCTPPASNLPKALGAFVIYVVCKFHPPNGCPLIIWTNFSRPLLPCFVIFRNKTWHVYWSYYLGSTCQRWSKSHHTHFFRASVSEDHARLTVGKIRTQNSFSPRRQLFRSSPHLSEYQQTVTTTFSDLDRACLTVTDG